MNLKFTLFVTRVMNKLFWQRHKGDKRYAALYEYLHANALEGKNFGTLSKVDDGGEKYVINLLDKYATGPMLIFDVGANKGQYQSLLCETITKSNYTIHSFEPSKFTFEKLVANKKNNSINNHNFGLGEREETLILYSTDHGSPLSSLYVKTKGDYYNVEQKKSEEVKIITLDTFCATHNIQDIYLLKMDVEGHELSVLKGAKNMLAQKKVSFIQFEFGPTNIDSRTYLRDFNAILGNDFRLYRVSKNGINEVHYTEKDEVFLPINYLAISKSLDSAKLNELMA